MHKKHINYSFALFNHFGVLQILQNFHDATHAPRLNGIAAGAESPLRVGQLGDSAKVRLLHLDQVRREHGHYELPAFFARNLREMKIGTEEETDGPYPFGSLSYSLDI